MKCQEYPNMVFKGVLTYEGHTIVFDDITDDDVMIIDKMGEGQFVSKVNIDAAIKKQRKLLEIGYRWV